MISDAEGAIRGLNAVARPALAPLARLLLRTESRAWSPADRPVHEGAPPAAYIGT